MQHFIPKTLHFAIQHASDGIHNPLQCEALLVFEQRNASTCQVLKSWKKTIGTDRRRDGQGDGKNKNNKK